MTSPGPPNTSSTARLILGELGFQVGWQQPVYVTAPAAGAQWKRKVDGRYYERVVAMAFTVTTDAVVANRVVSVQLLDGNGVVIAQVPATGTVVASSIVNVSLVINAPDLASAAAGVSAGFLPDMLIPPDWSWQSVATGFDVADTITNVVLLVQQFPNDATAIAAGQ